MRTAFLDAFDGCLGDGVVGTFEGVFGGVDGGFLRWRTCSKGAARGEGGGLAGKGANKK